MRRAAAIRPGRTTVDLDDINPIKRFLKRNLVGASGLALIAFTAALAAALATWSVSDPSLNHATGEPVRNALGWPGAVISDLLMQSIGLSTAVFLLPVILWGWRLFTGRALRLARRRVFAWFVGTLLAAGSLAALPIPEGWPLPTGLGGFLGDFVHHFPAKLMTSLTPGMATIVGCLGFGVPSLLLMLRAAGWIGSDPVEAFIETSPAGLAAGRGRTAAEDEFEDDEEDDDGDSRFAAVAGAVTHWGLLARATVRRTLLRRARRQDPADDYEEEYDEFEGDEFEDDDGRRQRSWRDKFRLRARLLPQDDDGLDAFYPEAAVLPAEPRIDVDTAPRVVPPAHDVDDSDFDVEDD